MVLSIVVLFTHSKMVDCVLCHINPCYIWFYAISTRYCYGDISYHTPKMDSSNLNIFSELARSGKTTSCFLWNIWQTDCKPRKASTSFVWKYNNIHLSPTVWVVLPLILSEDHNSYIWFYAISTLVIYDLQMNSL